MLGYTKVSQLFQQHFITLLLVQAAYISQDTVTSLEAFAHII